MKIYKLVKTETITKMLECFSNQTEYEQFAININHLNQELQYLGLKPLTDLTSKPEYSKASLAKAVA